MEYCPVVGWGACEYNNCMRKFKIFITVFTIYEFIMLTVLQINSYCTGVFNVNFCDYGAFKYFLMCIMLPVMIAIFMWWVPDLARSFCNKSCEPAPVESNESISDIFRNIVSKQDIERLMTAAIITGIQKFAKNYPKTKTIFGDILSVLKKPEKKK